MLTHCPDDQKSSLLYARIYTVRVGFRFSEMNNLILNLKMSYNESSQRLYYKQQAIRQFAAEMSARLTDQLSASTLLTLVPMSPSKDWNQSKITK